MIKRLGQTVTGQMLLCLKKQNRITVFFLSQDIAIISWLWSFYREISKPCKIFNALCFILIEYCFSSVLLKSDLSLNILIEAIHLIIITDWGSLVCTLQPGVNEGFFESEASVVGVCAYGACTYKCQGMSGVLIGPVQPFDITKADKFD